MDKTESLSEKFDGKKKKIMGNPISEFWNKILWEMQFQNFVQGQEMWGYVDGSINK